MTVTEEEVVLRVVDISKPSRSKASKLREKPKEKPPEQRKNIKIDRVENTPGRNVDEIEIVVELIESVELNESGEAVDSAAALIELIKAASIEGIVAVSWCGSCSVLVSVFVKVLCSGL